MPQRGGLTIEPELLTAPVHERIADDLRRKVRDGHWRAGALLPGRRELAKDYGVALKTLERAIAGLVTDGTLRTEGARGTFVAGTEISSPTRSTLGPAALTLGVLSFYSSDEKDIVSRRHNDWKHVVIYAMEQTFATDGGEGASVRFHNLNDSAATLTPGQAAAQFCATEGLDALAVVMVDELSLVDEITAAAEAAKVPVVFIPARELNRVIPQVSYDSRFAGHQAAAHLLRLGHQALLFLAPVAGQWVEDRLQGAREAVAQFGLPESALRIWPDPSQPLPEVRHGIDYSGLAYSAGKSLLTIGMSETGVIAANDHIAHGFLQAATEAGRKVGVDYAIVGFDDYDTAREAGLTSLHPPLEAMGHEAARLLVRALRYGENDAAQVRLRSYLIPRASTRPLSMLAESKAK